MISDDGIKAVLEQGRQQARIRAYETMNRDDLRDFLLKDMVASVRNHPLDEAFIKALNQPGDQ